MARTYENFDVEILRTGDTYSARVRSPRGEARAPFVLPLTSQELRILGLTVARGRKTARSTQTREVDEVKAYGTRLFDSLFTGDVLSCYHASLSDTRRSKAGLRVRLRLGDAPELAQVPWEYLFDRASGRFLALEEETPIVRYLDLPLPSGALDVKPPLRVLVMISGPTDVAGLDTDEEWRRLNEALGDLMRQGAVRLDRLEKATISALRWRLKAEEYHVFHFIGHGGVDAITERGVLIFEDEARRSDVVEAETVAGILSGEDTLRLAVLNACEGGRASKGDIFAGTAQCLVQQDVPAVIAMQFEISDEAAITLTHDFYKALSYGDPVDAALTEARRGLRYERRNELEWGTPVLYMRASDGRLFDVKSAPAPAEPKLAARPPEPERQLERPPEPKRGPVPDAELATPRQGGERRSVGRRVADLLHESQVAAFSENWGEASRKLAQVLELDPGNADASARLEEVRREEQLETLFGKGVEHENARRLGSAVDCFEKVRTLANRDYHGVDQRILTLREGLKGKKRVFWSRLGKGFAALFVLGVIASLFENEGTSAPYEPYVDPFVDANSVIPPAPSPDPATDGGATVPVENYDPKAAFTGSNGSASRDDEAREQGLYPYGGPILGSLESSGEMVHSLTLEAGLNYVIAGSCDASCSDLDLTISSVGTMIAQDVASDDKPVVTLYVTNAGTFQLTATMAGCGVESCGYRVQVYR